MKIAAINGSPAGRTGNTNVMVSALLSGAREAGSEVTGVFLAEKKIEYCRGCHTCWTETPGRCVIEDDMPEVLYQAAGADVIVLASPVYFNNVSGTLKVFMDRLTVTGGNPHDRQDDAAPAPASLVMVSSCGFPDTSHFQVISLWIKRVAMMMGASLLAEVYATQGKLLIDTPEESRAGIEAYLEVLKDAGREIALNLSIPAEIKERLVLGA